MITTATYHRLITEPKKKKEEEDCFTFVSFDNKKQNLTSNILAKH